MAIGVKCLWPIVSGQQKHIAGGSDDAGIKDTWSEQNVVSLRGVSRSIARRSVADAGVGGHRPRYPRRDFACSRPVRFRQEHPAQSHRRARRAHHRWNHGRRPARVDQLGKGDASCACDASASCSRPIT